MSWLGLPRAVAVPKPGGGQVVDCRKLLIGWVGRSIRTANLLRTGCSIIAASKESRPGKKIAHADGFFGSDRARAR